MLKSYRTKSGSIKKKFIFAENQILKHEKSTTNVIDRFVILLQQ